MAPPTRSPHLTVGLPGSAAELVFWFDELSLFEGRLHAAGWALCRAESPRVARLSLHFGASRVVTLRSFGLASPDLANHYGPHATASRFDERLDLDPVSAAICEPSLHVHLDDGSSVEIANLSLQCASSEPVHQLTLRFIDMVRQRDPGRMLEIGARRRVGATLRPQMSTDWTFVGLDIQAGPDVDVVGDAHEMSHLFPAAHFDAVMSLAVFEHLLMPWKVVIELNRVMRTGGIGFVVTPQAWPAHEEPWDFWRYSVHSWPALFNSLTGFEIIEARQGEKAFLVANRVHAGTNFDPSSVCYLTSAVLFRKVGETELSWPVRLEDVVRTSYPA